MEKNKVAEEQYKNIVKKQQKTVSIASSTVGISFVICLIAQIILPILKVAGPLKDVSIFIILLPLIIFVALFLIVILFLMSFMTAKGMIDPKGIAKEEMRIKNSKQNNASKKSIYETKSLTHGKGNYKPKNKKHKK